MNIIRKWWKTWSSTGIKTDMPLPLKQRIRLSNQMGILVAILSLSFLVFFSSRPHFNPLPMIVLVLASLSITGLNFLGVSALARLVLSIAPGLGTFALNISIKLNQPEQIALIHYISPRLFIVSTITLPLVLFSSREFRYSLLGIIIIMGLGVFSYEPIHAYLGIGQEAFSIESKKYSVIYEDIILMFITLFFALLFLRRINYQHEREVNKLLLESEEKQKLMQANQVALNKTLEENENTRKEEQKRNWISKGLADFAALLGQHQEDSEQLYRQLIAELVRYVGANQAGIYLLEEKMQGDQSLNLKACYAYNRHQYQKKTILMGEGLIGQTAQDRSKKYIDDLPEGYSKIISSLGGASPRYLLVVPLIFNENVEGVVEIASFQALTSEKLEFCEKLSHSIAAYIAAQRNQERNKRLLESSQKMFDRLQDLQTQSREQEKQYQAEIAQLKQRLEESQTVVKD